jgi:uncharacterized integral membrane protein (TIGR00697 family)
MLNEWTFLISIVVNVCFILLAARLGKEWIFGLIAVNLILVSIFGAKLITVFGLTTNAGNVFYAGVFLATHFILERYGRKSGMVTIWFGIATICIFTVLSQLSVQLAGLAASEQVNVASSTLFSFTLRISIASVIAFIFAQYINIYLYEWIRLRTSGKFLLLRSNISNCVAQLVDSAIFFSIAFVNLPGMLLLQAILAGWLIKCIVVAMGSPFLYADQRLSAKK